MGLGKQILRGIFGPVSSTDNAFMRWDGASGKVAQNSASATLDDSGGANFASAIIGDLLYVNSDGSGKVGIGTTSPTAPLVVKGSDTIYQGQMVLVDKDYASTDVNSLVKLSGYGNNIDGLTGRLWWFGSRSIADNTIGLGNSMTDGDLYLTTTGTGDVIIDNGNVGIGTTSPDNKLHVRGGIHSEGAVIHGTARITGDTTINTASHVVFADTDIAGFTITLPAGIEGQNFKIINCGSAANNATVVANGAELIFNSATKTIASGEKINIHYNSTEGWW